MAAMTAAVGEPVATSTRTAAVVEPVAAMTAAVEEAVAAFTKTLLSAAFPASVLAAFLAGCFRPPTK